MKSLTTSDDGPLRRRIAGWARRSDDPYRLPRLRVLGGTTPAELLQQLRGNRDDGPAPTSYFGSADA